MGRVILAIAALVLAQAVLPAAAQTLPSKKEMAALIQAAKAQRTLMAPGNPPFHLIASIRYTEGTKTADGKYEMLWADATHFHQEFRIGDISESDVANGNMRYILRNTPYERFSVWRIGALLGQLSPASAKMPAEKIVVRDVSAVGNLICAEIYSPILSHQVCLDPATKQIMSEHFKTKSPDALLETVFDDYSSFGNARYPRHALSVLDNTVEANVVTLNPVDHFANDVFGQPKGSIARAWCPDPKEDGGNPLLLFNLSLSASHDKLGTTRAYYFLVDTKGHVEQLVQTYPVEKVFSPGGFGEVFPVRKCGGKAIEYETSMFTNRLRP